jgi:acyl carrier protein
MMELTPRQNYDQKGMGALVSQVKEVVCSIAGQEITDSDAQLAGFGVDSLELLDILAAVEERFGIVLNENMVREFSSISRIASIIEDVVRSSAS